jgi:hypothetical protein
VTTIEGCDRPQARHRHERGAARFQAEAAAILLGRDRPGVRGVVGIGYDAEIR